MIYYYKYKEKYLFSFIKYNNFISIPEAEAKLNKKEIYFLNKLPPLKSRRNFLINSPSLLFINEEGVELLCLDKNDYSHLIPNWILEKIDKELVISLNTNYPNWKDVLDENYNKTWNINLVALGDVGSTLLIGLRLLGGKHINKIGIYDRNINRLKRWEYELNQIRHPTVLESFPPIIPISKDELFNSDMFIFCASKQVPPINSNIGDVRMAQFESNSKIIREYAIMARNENFKGYFAVVSDPVDLLCKVAFLESNRDKNSNYDFKGLASNQIIGYGLGVMNARASFYAEKSKNTLHYLKEGRVFGPHGENLIVADSIANYDEELSEHLTQKTINSNKEIRSFGFKPYVAPSLSSGALSIVETIKGNWFYGSTYMGGAYMGSRCRLSKGQLDLEQLQLPDKLQKRIRKTYERLVNLV